jgi:hypothetical protein
VPPQRHRRDRIGIALLAATLTAAGVGIGYGLHQQAPARPSVSKLDAQAYQDDPSFRMFAQDGQMRCQQIAPLHAECTDTDGLVMASQAAVSTDAIAYTFSYGPHVIYLQAFQTPDAAASWSAEKATKSLYPHLVVVDRFALWGTDPQRIATYQHLLDQATERAREAPMQTSLEASAPIPMPGRLAALALGTLGVSPQSLRAAVEPDDEPSVQILVALRLVMGGPAAADLPLSGVTSDPSDGSLVEALLPPPPVTVLSAPGGPAAAPPAPVLTQSPTPPPLSSGPVAATPAPDDDTSTAPPASTPAPPATSPPATTPPPADTPTPPASGSASSPPTPPPPPVTPTPPPTDPGDPPTTPPSDPGTPPTTPPSDPGTPPTTPPSDPGTPPTTPPTTPPSDPGDPSTPPTTPPTDPGDPSTPPTTPPTDPGDPTTPPTTPPTDPSDGQLPPSDPTDPVSQPPADSTPTFGDGSPDLSGSDARATQQRGALATAEPRVVVPLWTALF